MSTTLLWAGGALMASSCTLVLLALRDPKRLRAVAQRGLRAGVPWTPSARWFFAGATLTPGVLLMLVGQWPAFLIWFGATAAVGWALAQALAPRCG